MPDYKAWYEALAEIHAVVALEMYASAASDIERLIKKLDGTIEEPTAFFKPGEGDSEATARAMLHECVGCAGANGPSNIHGGTVHRLNHAYHIAKHLAGDS